MNLRKSKKKGKMLQKAAEASKKAG